MIRDLYLRADDEAAMNAALVAAGVIDGEGQPADGVAVDVIGPIVRFIDGEPETLPGWHVNVRAWGIGDDQIAALAGVSIPAPANPFRVFA